MRSLIKYVTLIVRLRGHVIGHYKSPKYIEPILKLFGQCDYLAHVLDGLVTKICSSNSYFEGTHKLFMVYI